jgi:L-ascorbate metabolism protein UlaG (beta-lactamase superfamily)
MLKIEWLGHSSFKLNYHNYLIVLDPFGDNVVTGLKGVHESAHIVYCSHEHKDHNARENVSLLPHSENPFKVTEINSYHDQSMGSQRGKNKILILQDKEVKCVHLGDIGCMPTDEELDLLMNIDVLMVPIGGHYTLNKEDVVQLIKRIKPKVIVPMHYRTERFGYDVIGGLDDFLKLLNYDVVYYHQSFMEYRSSMASHIAVLEPKNHL